METIKKIILLVSIIIFVSEIMYAQKFQIGIGAGYSKITNENYFTNNPTDNYGFGLGLDNLHQISAKLKYDLNVLPIYMTADLSYYSGGNNFTFLGSVNLYNSSLTDIYLESSIHIYSLGFGIEYPFQLNDFIPYLSVSFLANYFDLSVNQTPEPDHIFTLARPNFESSIKLGLSLGAGLDYKLYKNILLGLSLKYNFMNLSGKEDILFWIKEDDINMFNISLNVLYNLNIF